MARDLSAPTKISYAVLFVPEKASKFFRHRCDLQSVPIYCPTLESALGQTHAPFEIIALVRHRHFAGQRHDAVIDLSVHAVEDREVWILKYLPLHIAEHLQVFLIRGARWRDRKLIDAQQTWPAFLRSEIAKLP